MPISIYIHTQTHTHTHTNTHTHTHTNTQKLITWNHDHKEDNGGLKRAIIGAERYQRPLGGGGHDVVEVVFDDNGGREEDGEVNYSQ
jgi:hypothetical protein